MVGRRYPLIGITCITVQEDGRPPRLGQNRAYVDAIVRAGAAPLLIPPLADHVLLRTAYESLVGLLLSGGQDVDPAHYGETPHRKCGTLSPERDATELTLARWAVDEGKPLLAICRGLHVLNVALGGSLYQDIEAQVVGAGKHDWYSDYPRDHLPHIVTITPGTRLAGLVGAGPLPVNSLHHQAVKDVAPGLVATARTPDQAGHPPIIEAVEAPDHPFALGVQWHPEELAGHDVRAQRLFDALVEASRKRPAR